MNLGGLSAVYPGYAAQENQTALTEQNQAAAKEAAYKLLGAQVLGRALTGGGGAPAQPMMAPGAAMQGGPAMAPPPGQASVPNAPPAQARPAPAPAAPTAPGQGTPAPGGGGMPEISLPALTARILQTTPQVRNHPEILMAALERAAPLLDRASRDSLYDLRQEMQKQALEARERMVRMQQEGLNQRNAASTDARIYSADQGADSRRYTADRNLEGRQYTADSIARSKELSNEARRDVAKLSAETRREIAERAEQGRTDRAELSTTARKEIAQLNAETRREVVGMMEAGRERRADQASEDRRYGVDARSATAAEAESGRNARATESEAGKMRRAEMSLETRQAMQRMSQAARQELEEFRQAGSDRRAQLSAETRRELQGLNTEARKEITQFLESGRNERAAVAQQGQNDRAGARLERADRRLDQTDTREARLAASSAVKQDQAFQRLELQKAQLEQRVLDAGDKQAISQWRAVVDAQHKRAMEIIQASSIASNLKPAERKALIDEQNAAYMAAIVGMKRRMEQPAAPQAAPGAAPAPAPGAASASGTPPLNLLQEGRPTEFKNGQTWTLENGQPKRLK